MDNNNSTETNDKLTDAQKVTEFQKIGMLRTSAYNFEEKGLRVKEDHPLILKSRCFEMEGIDLSAGSMTDSTGQLTWRLSNFLCPPVPGQPFILPDFPISFVATPLSSKPAYMTATFKGVQSSPNDLIIQVYSWDSQGQPAPYMPFYWRCRLPLRKG